MDNNNSDLGILLKDACAELGLSLSDAQVNQFLDYKDFLLEYNNKVNLTAITDEREIILKHFVDSVTVCKFIDFKDKRIIDVGTGAGFPAVPMKIIQPNCDMVLLDSLNKRIKFLQELGDKIGLNNIAYMHSRAEDAGINKDCREQFDFCVSRAVAHLSILAEYDLPFVKVGGQFIALKGPLVDEELEEAKTSISALGGEIEKVESIKIPFSDINHKLVFIRKLRQTPKQYPRKPGKVTKNDIK